MLIAQGREIQVAHRYVARQVSNVGNIPLVLLERAAREARNVVRRDVARCGEGKEDHLTVVVAQTVFRQSNSVVLATDCRVNIRSLLPSDF